MGLFDLLSGRPDRMFGRGGGMSPVTMGVLGLLAYKAIQSMNKPGSGESGGGIGDWLHRTLGGDTSSRRDTGGILSGGLRDLIGQFQQSGHGDIARSWVGAGANRSITPDVLAKVLTEEQIATLMAHTGLGRDELLRGMSEELPPAVDKLTPEGDVPSPLEMDEVIGNKPA
ncbi:MAG: DUF937 domain-containing protein [Alphaproteobacteria bacterium]|nr:DUF937 domain-containing protein [Alphaproteobacteria bacterium]MCW5744008.1 DUF937 domain-containing protein [Alphaproteobacteria bacterium]